ncbi:MAG: hypothetical protein LLF76_07745 [Planctomycetaceae bacterium]|nr:hypothetical protein [Planctomycetaceae bacterium]
MDHKKWVVTFLFTSLIAAALGIDFMGPPTATLKKGQFKTDFTYHFSENDIELEDGEILGFSIRDVDVDDLETNRYYATFTYGLDERIEVYAKLGGITVEEDELDLSAGADVTYGIGTRITTNKSKEVDWGVGVLANWFDVDDDYSGSVGADNYNGEFDLDAYELQVTAGPTFKFPGWKLYGGVFFYMLGGDLDAEESGTILGNPYSLSASADLEADSNVGGYIGTVMHLTKNVDAMVEVAVLSDGYGIGGNIGWKF